MVSVVCVGPRQGHRSCGTLGVQILCVGSQRALYLQEPRTFKSRRSDK